jgi:hypothetical protein
VRAVLKLLTDLAERAELWLDDLPVLPFDPGRIRKLRRLVAYRLRQLAPPGRG